MTFAFGSTGQLFTQISQGAPFDMFLAADQQRPGRAEDEGLAVPGSRFTYATGKLALWSATPGLLDAGPGVLATQAVAHVAIANPVTAPYGAAALEAIAALGMTEALAPKLVEGQSISQTYQFAVTGNAAAAFVALAQLAGQEDGSVWTLPEELYAPIRQDAVLLARGAGNAAAEAFAAFLRGPEAQAIGQGPDVAAALRGAPGHAPVILMDHRPGNARANAAAGADLQLSGHTHGGMVRGLDRIVARFNDGFVSGHYRIGESQLYVNNGTALWIGFALRLGRPAELTVLTLRPA